MWVFPQPQFCTWLFWVINTPKLIFFWVHPKCGRDTVTVNGQHSLWLEGCKWTEHVKFANSCHNSNWWDLFTQDRQYKSGIRPIHSHKPSCSTSWSYSANWTICLYEAFSLKASCLKKQIIFFYIYAQTAVGIWQQDGAYQCPWWQPPFPSALSKLLEQIQQAFQLPPLAEGYLSLDSHKAHHTNISPPAVPLSFCSAVTFAMVLFLWQNEALPPLICLHLSSNLSAAYIHSQNMAA